MSPQLTTVPAVTTIPQGEPGRQHPDGADIDTVTAAAREALQKTMPGTYTPELADEIAARFTAALTRRTGQPTPCPVWPDLCADTTPGHYDHVSADHYVTDKRGERLIDVTFVQFSDERGDGPAKVSIAGMGSEDYDATEVREATARIRRLLDKADEIADTILTARQAIQTARG